MNILPTKTLSAQPCSSVSQFLAFQTAKKLSDLPHLGEYLIIVDLISVSHFLELLRRCSREVGVEDCADLLRAEFLAIN